MNAHRHRMHGAWGAGKELRQAAVATYAWGLVALSTLLHAAAGLGAWIAAVRASTWTDSQLVGALVLPSALCAALAAVRHLIAHIAYVPCEFRAGEASLERACWGGDLEDLSAGRVFGGLRWLTSLAAFAWHAIDALGTSVAEFAFGSTAVLLIAAGVYGSLEAGAAATAHFGSRLAGGVTFALAGTAAYFVSMFLVGLMARCMPGAEPHIEGGA